MTSTRQAAARKGLLWLRSLAVLVVALALSGCAARQGSQLAGRFIKPGEPQASYDEPGAVAAPPRESLASYGHRLRSLQSIPKTKSSLLPTIESSDPQLAAALLALTFQETSANHRAAATAYRNAGVLDYAYRHYLRALKLEPCDGTSHEGLARLWREWGRPELALGDVYRAIHCQPTSASAQNTLGTVLLALGQRQNARTAFDFALRLDAGAAFALNNLCYLSVTEGNGAGAQQECERALALDPALTTARTNLALAFALQGDIATAEQRLLGGPSVATGQFNVGILRMSLGKYDDAADAFELALKAKPNLSEAARRAVQARAIAASHKEH